MAKINEASKSERQQRVIQLLQRNPDGLREQEIAEILGFDRRVVNNYLRELETQGRVYKEIDAPLWLITPYSNATPRRFEPSAGQAIVLYLALRAFIKQSDRRNQIAEGLLELFATVLSEDLGLSNDLEKAAHELTQRPQAEGYDDILRNLANAYTNRCQVKVLYRPYRGEPFETILSPYLLEPSSLGFANYVIGYSSAANAIRTHKIERMLRVEVLYRQRYEIPDDLNILELLQNAWSIFYGEEVSTVVLRFHPDVVPRIQESYWRTTLETEWDIEQPGYLRITMQVADTTDLKPWIRSWGANCEVLEPDTLRTELIGEAHKLASLYGWSTNTAERDEDVRRRLNSIFGG